MGAGVAVRASEAGFKSVGAAATIAVLPLLLPPLLLLLFFKACRLLSLGRQSDCTPEL